MILTRKYYQYLLSPQSLFAGIAMLVFLFTTLNCFAADDGNIPSETIIGRLNTDNGFSWRYAYDIEMRDDQVRVKVSIHLIPVKGVTKLELDRAKVIWEEGIERIWSKRFAIRTATETNHPIVVDVCFSNLRAHHDVVVRPGAGRTDELNWNILDSATLVAHEFGHMIGCYDEYRGGAVSPFTRRIDVTSIMTSNPTTGRTDPRHYAEFVRWFELKNGMKPKNVKKVSCVAM